MSFFTFFPSYHLYPRQGLFIIIHSIRKKVKVPYSQGNRIKIELSS
ncbi:hypothetical protein HMPREF1989_00648, partial [Porphyromonas gingivalis F0566]